MFIAQTTDWTELFQEGALSDLRNLPLLLEATLLIDARGQDAAARLLERVAEVFPGGNVSVVEGGSFE